MIEQPSSASDSEGLSPPPIQPTMVTTRVRPRPFSHWAKRLLACNPFYLASAALLLFGIYRVSGDPNFLHGETAHLAFNFTSLQLYELLLAGAAILLARRCIWYDATLLVALENLLVLVPFILVSQAALINQQTVWALSVAAFLLAAARAGALQRWIAFLKPSSGLLAVGGAVLAANAALPVIYRILHESKVGTKPTWGAAYHMNEWSWLLVLPFLCVLGNLLPCRREQGDLWGQRRWFPASLFALWVAGTAVHLYCLGYVYDFELRGELIAPALWALAWTFHRRFGDFVTAPSAAFSARTLVLPLLATLAAASREGGVVFVALNLLNSLAYARLVINRRENRLALHLLLVSLAAVAAGLPHDWRQSVMIESGHDRWLVVVALGYLLLCSALSKNPKLGLLGAMGAAVAGAQLGRPGFHTFHLAAQSGLVFLLLHSLRWRDAGHKGAALLRTWTAVVWILDSFVWSYDGAPFWKPLTAGGVVAASYAAARWLAGRWPAKIVVVAALLVAISGPADLAFTGIQRTPVGVAAIGGSFILLILGTVAALTKRYWYVTHGNGREH